MRRVVEVVSVGRADDQDIDVGGLPSGLPLVTGRPGAEAEGDVDPGPVSELFGGNRAGSDRAEHELTEWLVLQPGSQDL